MNDSRHYVIDYAVKIEELASFTLGQILEIDWKNSESIGFGSSSLSFNQKIKIIQELHGLNDLQRDMLQNLMYIRNKFAHVRLINSFEALFQNSSKGKEVRKFLIKNFATEVQLKQTSETVFQNFFGLMCDKILKFLVNIAKDETELTGLLNLTRRASERFIEIIEKDLEVTDEGKSLYEKAWQKLKDEIENKGLE